MATDGEKISGLGETLRAKDAQLLPLADPTVVPGTNTKMRVDRAKATFGVGSYERAAGRDDFDHDVVTFWNVSVDANADLTVGPGGAAFGVMGSNGVVALGTSGSSNNTIVMHRWATGLVLDVDQPIITEWRWVPLGNDDSYTWLLGIAGPDGTDGPAILFGGLWDSGPNTRTYALAILNGSMNLEAFTPPTLGAGKAYRARLTVAVDGVTLEMAVDDDEYEVVATSSEVPQGIMYSPWMTINDGEANRTLLVDYVEWDAWRPATDGAAVSPVEDYFREVGGGETDTGDPLTEQTYTTDGELPDNVSLAKVNASGDDVGLSFSPTPLTPGPRRWLVRGRWASGKRIRIGIDAAQIINGVAGPGTLTLTNTDSGEGIWLIIREDNDTIYTVQRLHDRPDVRQEFSAATENMSAADDKSIVYALNAAGLAVTVPDGLPIGTTVHYVQGTANPVQIIAGGSMNLAHPGDKSPETRATHSRITVEILTVNVALVSGDMA